MWLVIVSSAFGAIEPVSSPSGVVSSGGGGSFTPVMTADGRFVAFVSQANNLTTNDDLAPLLDVFLRDVVSQKTILVSANLSGTGGGNGNSSLPTVSSNGALVAFESIASNLVENDTNGVIDVFVRDILAGTTTLISRNTNGTSANGASFNPRITPDGRRVVFESAASNLTPDDTNGVSDVFVYDLQTEVTLQVSIGFTNKSIAPAISDDGTRVAFITSFTNAATFGRVQADIFVRDLRSNVTLHVTADLMSFVFGFPGPLPGSPNVCAGNPVFSSNAQVIAYTAECCGAYPRAPGTLILRHDLQTRSTVRPGLTDPNIPPAMTADGRFIPFEDYYTRQMFLWDTAAGTNTVISTNQFGQIASARCYTPVISGDGSRVVFLSSATNLVPSATNRVSQVFASDIATGEIRLVSATPDGGPSSKSIDVTLPAITVDGRFITFESTAGDLLENDSNFASDIFMRDVEAGVTHLVSERAESLPPATGIQATLLPQKSVSSNAQLIAFFGRDNNVVPDDTNGVPNNFVHDLASGVTHLLHPTAPDTNSLPRRLPDLSVSSGGRYVAFTELEGFEQRVWRYDVLTRTSALVTLSKTSAPFSGWAPAISPDGRFIAFESSAPPSFVLNGIGNGAGGTNIYIRDMDAATNHLVSVDHTGTISGNGPSIQPSFRPDGRWVLFASMATDLTPTQEGGAMLRLFARDLVNGRTVQVSGPASGVEQPCLAKAVFSANSQRVAWVNASYQIFVTDLSDRSIAGVCNFCENPSLNTDGTLIAYERRPYPPIFQRQIMTADLETGFSSFMSVGRTGGSGNADSTVPQISGDGRFVVFASRASNLVENDTNGFPDIFVRDRLLGVTMLVSANSRGVPPQFPSSRPIMAADGRTVVFQSFANDLIPGDYNDHRDIFVLRLGAPDTDGDGLDDDWELAWFNDLTQDGTGDADGDGQSDRNEFLAGTSPTNNESILRVLTISAMQGSNTTVLWSAVAGRTYRVQFKDVFDDTPWMDLPGDITATSSTASALDSAATDHRFYRVLRLP